MDKLRRVICFEGTEREKAIGVMAGYFHGLFPSAPPYVAKAIIETEDGRLIEVLPEFIRFLDKPEDDSEDGFISHL